MIGLDGSSTVLINIPKALNPNADKWTKDFEVQSWKVDDLFYLIDSTDDEFRDFKEHNIGIKTYVQGKAQYTKLETIRCVDVTESYKVSTKRKDIIVSRSQKLLSADKELISVADGTLTDLCKLWVSYKNSSIEVIRVFKITAKRKVYQLDVEGEKPLIYVDDYVAEVE